ncbi:hypothetical protein GEMRC1_008843 [Eukaryota sp. GEM-RC1]
MVRNEVSGIYLRSNSIGSEGAIPIAEALKVNSSVTEIYLGNNSINSQTQQSLKPLHKNRMQRSNDEKHRSGLTKALHLRRRMVRNEVSGIYLRSNSIGSEGAIPIAEALKVNSSVTEIYLGNNSINSQTQQSLKPLHKNRMRF